MSEPSSSLAEPVLQEVVPWRGRWSGKYFVLLSLFIGWSLIGFLCSGYARQSVLVPGESGVSMALQFMQPMRASQFRQPVRVWPFVQSVPVSQVQQSMQLPKPQKFAETAKAAASGEASAGSAPSGTATAADKLSPPPCPRSMEAQKAQAVAAIKNAMKAGVTRMQIELELPSNFATDLDDWPGGIRQQYQVLKPLLEDILQSVTGVGTLKQEEIDDADAVYILRNEKTPITAVSFPTADVLGELKDLEKKVGDGVLLLANPQWSLSGQVVSDLGFGPWRKNNEEFIAKFDKIYWQIQKRIKGEQVQILKTYPFPEWQVFVIPQGGGAAERAFTSAEQPEYWQMEEKLSEREGSIASQDWLQRAQGEMKFNIESLQEKKPPQ